MKDNNSKVSMINEQGDLGLWCNDLSESDQKLYDEQLEKEKKDKEDKDK